MLSMEMHVNIKVFKTIEVKYPDSKTRMVHYRNPYTDDPYSGSKSRSDICKQWREETKLREQELDIFDNDISNRA